MKISITIDTEALPDVTPEMLEAGVVVFSNLDEASLGYSLPVAFQAMWKQMMADLSHSETSKGKGNECLDNAIHKLREVFESFEEKYANERGA